MGFPGVGLPCKRPAHPIAACPPADGVLALAQVLLGRLHQLGPYPLDRRGVVEHGPDGKIKLHQTMSPTGAGALGGAAWGGLIGLLFLAPLFGMAIGAATCPRRLTGRAAPVAAIRAPSRASAAGSA